jgi:hypothetical protein
MKIFRVIGLLLIAIGCHSNYSTNELVPECELNHYSLCKLDNRKVIMKSGLIIDEVSCMHDIAGINVFLDSSGSYVGYYEKSNRSSPLITNGIIVGFMKDHIRICTITNRELNFTDKYSFHIEGENVKIYNSSTGEIWLEKLTKTMNMVGR